MSIVYLNGEFLPVEEARVSVMDRGFIFGDGVYEVIPVYGGRLFRLEQHLQRLARSLAEIRLTNPLSSDEWRQCLQHVVQRNGEGDQSVYVQVTRGTAPRDHAFPKEVRPTVYAASSVLKPLTAELVEHGVAAISLPDIRWQRCDIKAITLLPNILLRQQAIDQGAVEAILVRDGQVNEGAASNVFIVKDSVLITPPKGPFLLPGGVGHESRGPDPGEPRVPVVVPERGARADPVLLRRAGIQHHRARDARYGTSRRLPAELRVQHVLVPEHGRGAGW